MVHKKVNLFETQSNEIEVFLNAQKYGVVVHYVI